MTHPGKWTITGIRYEQEVHNIHPFGVFIEMNYSKQGNNFTTDSLYDIT